MSIGQAADAGILFGAAKAEEIGQSGFALQDQDGALFDARRPLGRGGGARARHENAGDAGWLALQADGGKDLGPRARVFG